MTISDIGIYRKMLAKIDISKLLDLKYKYAPFIIVNIVVSV